MLRGSLDITMNEIDGRSLIYETGIKLDYEDIITRCEETIR